MINITKQYSPPIILMEEIIHDLSIAASSVGSFNGQFDPENQSPELNEWNVNESNKPFDL